MMLSDEPYRWAEAVANRRDYIEDQLRRGSPVVGVGYEGGILLLTTGKGQEKLYEVYDQIGLAAIGHSTDIEKLRQAAIDMAHSIGFQYSETDVTLRQIVHFGLGPAMKAGFDEVIRSPYLARVLLAELGGMEGARTFYIVDYDGAFQKYDDKAALGGFPEADRVMEQVLKDLEPDGLTFDDAFDLALRAWAAGRWAGLEESSDDSGLEERAAGVDFGEVLRNELRSFEVESAVLEQDRKGKCKYRRVGSDEAAKVLKAYQEDE